MKLQGKRVLVTGGSSGIGFAIAKALLARGARIAITGRRSAIVSAAVEELRKTGGGGSVTGIAADVGTEEGRTRTLRHALDTLGGLDILVNNAGGVRAGRLEATSQKEIETMLNVDLLAPILLTRSALPSLRASGDAMVVNVTSRAALIGSPFYATYAAAKAGLARFGEALRRELKGEGIHVMTVYPGGTDTPMMKTNRAGPELGFGREPASEVADATVEGIETDVFEVIRGGEALTQTIVLNRDNPAAIDERMLAMKPALEEAVKDHSAL